MNTLADIATACQILADLGLRSTATVCATHALVGPPVRAIVDYQEARRAGLPLQLSLSMRRYSVQPWYAAEVRGVLIQCRDDAGSWPEEVSDAA